ncbi:DgyrCDS3146 [Dimorphilus gyrociliatus]|uniref:DgyrCDS3146 n=1 Tax=Dimorphilus gyrociliatus TaxID=2664684 RepID=A0A7I8VFB4_9ANNE|nr:DgyrCDS3146 [Dimorphilus gyrociliatus]
MKVTHDLESTVSESVSPTMAITLPPHSPDSTDIPPRIADLSNKFYEISFNMSYKVICNSEQKDNLEKEISTILKGYTLFKDKKVSVACTENSFKSSNSFITSTFFVIWYATAGLLKDSYVTDQVKNNRYTIANSISQIRLSNEAVINVSELKNSLETTLQKIPGNACDARLPICIMVESCRFHNNTYIEQCIYKCNMYCNEIGQTCAILFKNNDAVVSCSCKPNYLNIFNKCREYGWFFGILGGVGGGIIVLLLITVVTLLIVLRTRREIKKQNDINLASRNPFASIPTAPNSTDNCISGVANITPSWDSIHTTSQPRDYTTFQNATKEEWADEDNNKSATSNHGYESLDQEARGAVGGEPLSEADKENLRKEAWDEDSATYHRSALNSNTATSPPSDKPLQLEYF